MIDPMLWMAAAVSHMTNAGSDGVGELEMCWTRETGDVSDTLTLSVRRETRMLVGFAGTPPEGDE